MNMLIRKKVLNYGEFRIPIVLHDNVTWFKACPIARILGYSNRRRAIIDNVKNSCKKALSELCSNETFKGNTGNTIYINKEAIDSLVFRSRLLNANEFRRWVDNQVLSDSCYLMNRFKMETEKDLHYKVVHFIRKRFTNCLLSTSLGELQDSPDKRI